MLKRRPNGWREKSRVCKRQDILNTLGLSFDHESVTYLIKEFYGHYGNWFNYNHHIKNNKEIFHLRHNLGEKWSVYVSEVISTLFEYGFETKK